MEATQKEREMVEAVEAQATEKGSHVIVKTNGPATLRSIEMTETAVTAMTAEIARNKMKDTDVVEMHTEIGKSQRKKGGRPAGSPALSAGMIETKIASETAVGTETAARGRTGVRGGPGRTTDPGTMKTGKIVDPAVAMMKVPTPEESGASALTIGMTPDRVAKIAALMTDRPERAEARETVVGPLLNIGDRSALLIAKSLGRTTVQRPDATQDPPRHLTAQGRDDRQQEGVPMVTAPHLCPEAPRNRGSSASSNARGGAKSASSYGTWGLVALWNTLRVSSIGATRRIEDQEPPRIWELEPELLCFSPCRRSHRSPRDLAGVYLWLGHRRVDLSSS